MEIIIQDASSMEGKDETPKDSQAKQDEPPRIEEIKRVQSPVKEPPPPQVNLTVKKEKKEPVPKISQSTIKSYNIDSFSLDDDDDMGPSNRYK